MSRKSESGSAVVEFVLLAIPLFLPILLFIGQFSELSSGEMASRTLVREVVRAFVTADNEVDARARSSAVMEFAARKLGFSNGEIASMRLSFECSSQPCFTSGGGVSATLQFRLPGSGRQIKVLAREFVSPWQ